MSETSHTLPALPLRPIRLNLPSVTSPEWQNRAQSTGRNFKEGQFDISIVLNLHREAIYLQRTLLSLIEAVEYARQTDKLSFELVIVLDNSDARTTDWATADQFQAFDAVKTVKVKNGSLGLSRNSGIEAVSGTYVATCDADDLISFNLFSELYRLANQYSDPVAIFPEYLLAFGDTAHMCKYFDGRNVPTVAYFDGHPFISRIFIATDYAKKHPYKHADHKKDYAYEDWCFTSELIAKKIPILVAPNTTLYYRQRGGSLLREANATSTRLVHPNDLLEPATFVESTNHWAEIVPDGIWEAPDRDSTLDAFFNNPVNRACAVYANKIDPAITFDPGVMTGIFTNLHCNGKMGVAYRRACQLMVQRDYTDVIIIPFLTTGGGEKYILNLIDGLEKLGIANRFLFLSGQEFAEHLWLDRLPPNSDFIDLFEVCRGDETSIDIVTLRLIQFAGKKLRIHLKSSGYAHRFLAKFGKLIQNHNIVYYRFCDEHIYSGGDVWRDGSAFQFISENLDNIHTIISDQQHLVKQDRFLFGLDQSKWHCLYTKCDSPKKAWAPPNSDKIELLWASRLSSQKRQTLLVQLLSKLSECSPNIHVNIFGRCDPNVSADIFKDIDNATYHGPFDDFFNIDLAQYHALLYTAHFDGLPNVVLEAMAAGLPVIAPQIGGLAEVIDSDESGWLVETNGDDVEDARRYASLIENIDFSSENLRVISKKAKQRIVDQHSEAEFLNHLREIFGS